MARVGARARSADLRDARSLALAVAAAGLLRVALSLSLSSSSSSQAPSSVLLSVVARFCVSVTKGCCVHAVYVAMSSKLYAVPSQGFPPRCTSG